MNHKIYKLYEFIRQQILLRGSAPSFSQMANRMKGVSKQTVEDWLIILEKEGYIKRIGTSQRRILLTRQGQKLPDTHQVPPTFNESVSLLSSASISVETSLDQPTSIPVASGNIYVEVSNINLVPMKGGERDGTT